jgi:hypothetical protein
MGDIARVCALSSLLLVAVCGTACSRETDDAAPPLPRPAFLAEAVNAKLPPEAGVVFEDAIVENRDWGWRASAARPADWVGQEAGFWPGSFHPIRADLDPVNNEFQIGVNCDGSCEPKNWPAIIDEFMRGRIPAGEGVHDEILPERGRIRWGMNDGVALVFAAWYDPGGNHYRYCEVTLVNEKLFAALDAFVQACKTVRFLDLGAAGV